MKSIVYSFFFLIALGSVQTAFGQQAKLDRANKLFRELNYQDAIKLYEQVLRKEVIPTALFNLPECYRKIGDVNRAEYWYSQAVLHPESTPEMHFYLGLAKLSNDKPQEARTSFEKFIELSPGDSRGKKLLTACKDSTRQLILNSGALFQVRNVEELNTRYDEFGVTFHNKGIVYCAERDTAGSGGAGLFTSAWTGRPFVDVYYVDARLVDEDKMEYKYGKTLEFDKLLNTRLHDGPICFSPDGSEMYFTRNFFNKGTTSRSQEGIINTQIMRAKYGKNGWKKPQTVEFSSPEYSVAHPALTPAGDKMYFAADLPGGFGRMDLYVSYLEGNRWSAPINLGPEINTEGDEIFPWVNADNMLYFSSDGHTGMGGFDIYYTKAEKGRWAPLENIGAPVNSNRDDFGFVTDSTGLFGYFSSNREGGVGNTDIYSFTKLAVYAEMLVFDKMNGRGLEGIVLTSDCFPKQEFVTNIEGKVILTLPLNRNCSFNVHSELFGDTTISVSTQGYAIGAELFIQAPMVTRELAFNVEGKIVDEDTNEPIADAQVTLMTSCGSATKVVKVGPTGTYGLQLAPNCCYVVKAVKDGYFTTTTNFCTRGLNKDSNFVANIAMPTFFNVEGLDPSKTYGVENIYYDYADDRINIERSTGLKKMLDLLINNPTLAVEIHSHTDSRGPNAYNQALSTRRAKAVADYLIQQGISEDRVGYKGFGESQLINSCDDNSTCSEEEHRLNRRTEFKVIQLR